MRAGILEIILHQQYDAVGSHTVQEAKHNPNPNRL